MKRAVSISIGSSKRDKAVEVELLGEKVHIERIGTDGDMQKAARLYHDMDGTVDAFGVGGADLGVLIEDKWYPLYSVAPMVRGIKHTPVVDGAGLKNTLENKLAPFIDAHLGDYVQAQGKKVLVTLGVDRWGMTKSFLDAGYECVFGDLMFGLGIPIAIRSERALKRMAAILMPIAGRLPFEWVYPTGEKQEKREPKWEQLLPVGYRDRWGLPLHQAAFAGSPGGQDHRHEHHHARRRRIVPPDRDQIPGDLHPGAGGALLRHEYDGSRPDRRIRESAPAHPGRAQRTAGPLRF